MAIVTVIPVSEYLNTIYHPDCDYVDGVVEERNLDEKDHSRLQRHFIRLLGTPENEIFVDAFPELRVQISSTLFRTRSQDFLKMGFPEVWIVDPATRQLYVCRTGEMAVGDAETLNVLQRSTGDGRQARLREPSK